jgi:hypothetical protein
MFLHSYTLLWSGPKGKDQSCHLDFLSSSEKEESILIFLPLSGFYSLSSFSTSSQSLTGSSMLGVNISATLYYQETRDHNFYVMDSHLEKVVTVNIAQNSMMMMWDSVVHFGKGYTSPSYRMLVVLSPKHVNQKPKEPNDTFFIGGEASSETWRAGAASASLQSLLELTYMKSEEKKNYEEAKKEADC